MPNEPRNPLLPTYTLQDIATLGGVSYRKLRMDIDAGAVADPPKDQITGRIDANSAWDAVQAIRALSKAKRTRERPQPD